jgi:hypothetical protein
MRIYNQSSDTAYASHVIDLYLRCESGTVDMVSLPGMTRRIAISPDS